jgi:hypothetical protein
MVLTLLLPLVRAPVSAETIPKSVDDEMDKANPSNGHVKPGISIRNGPMKMDDHPMPDVNGVDMNGTTSKRKSRGSLARPSYAEADTSDEDNQPLVRLCSLEFARIGFIASLFPSRASADSCSEQATSDIA